MNDKPKHPGGRPTDYTQDVCERVIEYGKEGHSITAIACLLGQAKRTIYEWKDVHPEFSHALQIAMQFSQLWWEERGRKGMDTAPNQFNTALWAKNMSCRFRDDWTETNKTELTGKDGGAVAVDTTVNLRPQLTPEQWLEAHGLGTSAGASE